MAIVSFLYPNFLWFLFFVPFFIFVYFFGLSYNKKKAIVFSNFNAIKRFYGIEFFNKNYLYLYLNLIVLIFLILVLAGTQIHFGATTSSYSYVLLIDNSHSMSADDIKPNRFIAAKDAAKIFVSSLPLGVNVGVVGFSGSAVVYQEMISDKMRTRMAIDNIDYGEIAGTNIYSAIVSANRLFERADDEKLKAIILISDGQVNVGEAPLIISLAERSDIVIHTIAVGTVEGGVTDTGFVSRADIDFMKALAFNTGGQFFSVEETDDFSKSFSQLVERIDDIIKIDLSLYLLIIAILLFVINWILYNFRFRVFP